MTRYCGTKTDQTVEDGALRDALHKAAQVVVLGTGALQQRDRLGERLHALLRTVRHVDRGLAPAADEGNVGALLHEVDYQLVVHCLAT